MTTPCIGAPGMKIDLLLLLGCGIEPSLSEAASKSDARRFDGSKRCQWGHKPDLAVQKDELGTSDILKKDSSYLGIYGSPRPGRGTSTRPSERVAPGTPSPRQAVDGIVLPYPSQISTADVFPTLFCDTQIARQEL